MENNKFNKFYSRKPVTELIEQLRAHRNNINLLDKEWFEALKLHLSERDISTEERQTVSHILSEDFDKEMESLNKQKNEFERGQKTRKHSNLIINPTNIISAGKNIKSVVYVVLVMTFFAIIAIVTANTSTDPDTITTAYILLGGASLICNIIILFQLHSAGDNLENSVYNKEE
jgi:hypothetical protein